MRVASKRGRFYLTATPAEQNWIRANVPTRTWDNSAHMWYADATPTVASFLAAHCPESIVGDLAFNECAKTLNRIAEVRALDIDVIEPRESNTSPFDHQKRALELISTAFMEEVQIQNRHDLRAGFLLLHDMGVGKTKVVVDLACNHGYHRILIICPKSVVPAWRSQFAIHGCKDFNVLLLDSGPVKRRCERLMKALKSDAPLVVVVNYEASWRHPLGAKYSGPKGRGRKLVDPGVLMKTAWDLGVADECHRLKDPNGVASKFISDVALLCPRRLGLTGTPMPKDPLDMFGQFRFADRGVFGTSFYGFRNYYAVMGGYENKVTVAFRNQAEFAAKIATLSDRVMADDVLDLPEHFDIQVPLIMSDVARKLYRQLDSEFVVRVDRGEIDVSNALTELIRLQQCTSGYMSVTTGEDAAGRKVSEITFIDDAKKAWLADKLLDLPDDEGVIVFCKYLPDIEQARDVAEKAGREFYELRGAVKQRDEWESACRDGRGAVIAVQIRAGGVGVDLTAARYVVYFSIGFEYGDFEQSTKRVLRQGQTRQVTYYYLVVLDSVDERVYRAIANKEKIIKSVLAQVKERHNAQAA